MGISNSYVELPEGTTYAGFPWFPMDGVQPGSCLTTTQRELVGGVAPLVLDLRFAPIEALPSGND